MNGESGLLQIRTEHQERQAFVYVRQSTLMQVREHTGSRARQYDLTQRALDLGWPPERIQVLDQDQGRSGASATEREGFQLLVAEVGLGHAGAVLCLEASRLARACADWYRLLEICALTHTLVIDEEGVYDPSQYNDRLLLGIKGTMSEAELHWLRQRLVGGKQKKAQQGTLRIRLPIGYVWGPQDTVRLEPDESVREAVALLFRMFAELGSAFRVVRYFGAQQLLFPSRPIAPGGARGGADETVWRPLRLRRIIEVLHNPVYAGAYAFGRTRQEVRYATAAGEAPGRQRQRAADPADWPVLIRDHHPAYLSWEEFVRNQERLAANTFGGRRTGTVGDDRAGQGAPREGCALLQGLVRCGQCGERMTVMYQQDGKTPHYICCRARAEFTSRTCQSLRGDGLDAAVGRLLLEAVQPAALAVALRALEELEARARQVERQWELRRERVRYEAELARRRFRAVDPDNRLVARSLERDWEEALAAVARVEREYTTRAAAERLPVGAAERAQLLGLAQDLPALWAASTTTNVERKQLVRCLIREVTVRKESGAVRTLVRWHTGAVTELRVPRPLRVWETRQPDPGVLERIRELAPTHADAAIAPLLNTEGWTTGMGLAFDGRRVGHLRRRAGIPSACPADPRQLPTGVRGDGRRTVQSVAAEAEVCIATVVRWCLEGRLDGVQEGKGSPWWVRVTPADLAALRQVGRRKRRPPRVSS
jgi:DNA invertase Pin-like site-specific DNA recombinase